MVLVVWMNIFFCLDVVSLDEHEVDFHLKYFKGSKHSKALEKLSKKASGLPVEFHSKNLEDSKHSSSSSSKSPSKDFSKSSPKSS